MTRVEIISVRLSFLSLGQQFDGHGSLKYLILLVKLRTYYSLAQCYTRYELSTVASWTYPPNFTYYFLDQPSNALSLDT